MYTSRLAVDTKVKSASGPHSAKSRSNKENLAQSTAVSNGKQRPRSGSNASTSSSVSASTNASTSSLAPPKSFHGMASQSHPQPVSPSQDETVRIGPEYVLAMHDYEPQQSNTTCLSFRTGQVIHVLNRDASGWWDGELEGRRGWFPSNYVNVDFGKSRTQAVQPQRAQHQYTPSVVSWATASSRKQHSRQPSAEGFSADPIHYSTPLMIPMVHGLSLLQNAVRTNRVTHFQPSAACIIACVRRILNTTETINRDAPVLRRFPVLARVRSELLTTLAKLVSQARQASEENLSHTELANEIAEMLKTGGLVFSHVRRFVAIAVQCGIELPQEPDDEDGSSPTEARTWGSADEAGGGGVPSMSPNGRTPTQQRQWEKSKAPPSPTSMRAKSMVNLRNGPSAQSAAPLSRTSSAQVPGKPSGIRERVFTRHKPESSIGSTSSSSSFSSQGSSGALSPPLFPSGPTTSIQVLDALRYTHDQYLSTIAAFIGHAHSYSRSSHASNTGHLYELTREIVRMVERVLTIVVAVMSHPEIPTHRVNNLRSVNEGLYTVASTLTDSIRRLTIPLAPTMSEEEEKAALIRSATGALKAGADCVSAVKVCLNRAGGERSFIIDLPYEDGRIPQPQPLQQNNTARGVLNKATSMSALHGYRLSRAHTQEDEEDVTIHPGPSNLVARSREFSSGSDNSRASKTSWAQSVDTAATSPDDHRPPPLSFSRAAVEPDLPSPVSFTRTDDDRTTWEGSMGAHGGGVAVLEENVANGELPAVSLGFDQDPANWMYTHDYSLEDVAYNNEGHLVGATLEALVEKMTSHDAVVDPAFLAVFFMTFRLFTSPTELVDAIIARYNLVPPRNESLSIDELRLWQHKKGLPVRLRVANLMKGWVEVYWRPGVDDPVLPTVTTWVKEALRGYFPGPAQRLLESLEMRKQQTEMAKADPRLLRSPPNVPIPTSGLPSDIPRPNMTKTLLVALRKKDYTNISVTDFDALELARQITVMECTLYCAIQPEEILEAGQQDGARVRVNVNVKAVTSLSTVITGWVAESILNEQDLKKRTLLIKFFIKVADRCTSLNNYSTSRSILAALDSSTIARLRQTWAGVPQKSKTQLESLRKLADHGRNYHEYRSRLRNTSPPAVPFLGNYLHVLGLYLTDITFCREGNASHRFSPLNDKKKLLNFNKYHKLARIVQDMQRFQMSYNLKAILEVQDYLNVSFENSKHNGDFQDLYRRSLLVEPKQPADTAPTGDMRQLFNWATRSQSATAPS
ncbi:ras GEF [Macrolepiota fuliginosa MF-IS2]|uniref:Ras GEF n=1 Tax=Macrolepiota fuliginosa MF-IS2 TaxID=1400762 RepID=A0A9P5XQJ4_9AGAR|nr:ras GEF [Macrolepiota fuliginosa MF-IS2]